MPTTVVERLPPYNSPPKHNPQNTTPAKMLRPLAPTPHHSPVNSAVLTPHPNPCYPPGPRQEHGRPTNVSSEPHTGPHPPLNQEPSTAPSPAPSVGLHSPDAQNRAPPAHKIGPPPPGPKRANPPPPPRVSLMDFPTTSPRPQLASPPWPRSLALGKGTTLPIAELPTPTHRPRIFASSGGPTAPAASPLRQPKTRGWWKTPSHYMAYPVIPPARMSQSDTWPAHPP
ncbi:unnamed protein product [Pleuronectes platessa]|uniref:Uncharacterized protein n=1 Tax=Pleuronectes platessa TaxID=8262 RepID=A0A9N7W0P0_PLEPL|nr:unnamed protein product [Pleuronectes platessa]